MTTPSEDDPERVLARVDAINAVMDAVARLLGGMTDDQLDRVAPGVVVAAIERIGERRPARLPDIQPRREAVLRWFATGDFKRWRTTAKWTQTAAAGWVKVHTDRWALWERGKYQPRNDKIDVLYKLGRQWAVQFGETTSTDAGLS